MRIAITGSSEAAAIVRGMITRGASNCVVSADPKHCDFTVQIDTLARFTPYVEIDGVDCDLERNVIKHICDLIPLTTTVNLKRAGGNQSDSVLIIGISSDADVLSAVTRGVYRGLMETISVLQVPKIMNRVFHKIRRMISK